MKSLFYIFSFIVICFVLGCGSDKQKGLTPESDKKDIVELDGEIIINGADALYPIMKIWAEEFSNKNPKLNIIVNKGGTGNGLSDLLSGNCNLAMVSRKLSPDEEGKGLICFRVTKEGVIPIINEKNPYIDKILTKGVNRNTLIDIFTGNQTRSWGDLFIDENKDIINIYTRSDLSGAASVWATYLDNKQEALKGYKVAGDDSIINSILNDPLGLSYCNAHYAFNNQSKTTHRGIIVLPIDLNNNGIIDKKELFNNDICMLERSVYLGTYPSCLCRYLYLVASEKPTHPAIIEFLKWIYVEGQEVAEKNGYSRLRSCEAEEYIHILSEP